MIMAAALRGGDRSPNQLTRVRRGVYVRSDDWPGTEREARHYVRMQAVVTAMRTQPIFSHASAAVIWGIPVVGRFDGVHIAAGSRSGRRSRFGLIWHNHRLGDADVVEFAGHLVTSLERTLWDLACTSPMPAAVAAIDAGIAVRLASPLGGVVAGMPRAALLDSFAARGAARGSRRAGIAAEFGDGRSGSPGESISRWNMHALGFPAPELQVPFARADGGRDIVDFDWPEFGVFGEFDGRGKYLRDEFTGGRPIEDVVYAEKQREDRVRRHRPRGIRWGWSVASEPAALARELRAGGLPQGRPRCP